MAWLQDINLLFSSTYAAMVAKRSTLGLSPLQPAALSNFQIGPEYLAQEQAPPRIVIVPVENTYDFAQQLPTTAAAMTAYQKSLYTRSVSFEAYIWGDPDPASLDTTYSFNSALELEREFLGAMYSQIMGGRSPRGALTPISARWIVDETTVGMLNTYGRLYVLTFQIAMPVLRDNWTTSALTTITTTPYITDPVTGANPQSTTPVVIPTL